MEKKEGDIFIMFIENWQNLKNNLYPGDEFLEQEKCYVYFKNFNDYVKSDLFGDPHDIKIHIGLKPVPYVGNLSEASIFLLMLNPGLSASDYIEDNKVEFNELYKNNIYQKDNKIYPFFIVNPKLCFHSGYNYWIKKLGAVIEKIKKSEGVSWLDAQKKISKKIAVLELIPYHSKNFRLSDKVIEKMTSVRDIKNYVKENLVPKAREHKCLIIVMRSSKKWDLREDLQEENIIVYNNAEARQGGLGKKTRGYKEIIKHLKYET